MAAVAEIVTDTMRQLRLLREQHEAVLVAFSGGKDSLVVLDLCKRTFPTVVCFFMYFVPGLRVCEDQLEAARQRWGIEILRYPHWAMVNALREGIYCPNGPEWDNVSKLTVGDVYRIAAQDTGISLIATGCKGTDFWQRRQMIRSGKLPGVHPLEKWKKADVLAYLSINQIPLPPSFGHQTTGIDLTPPSLLWLHDNYPDDFKTLCQTFPYAQAAIYRRDWFGLPARKIRGRERPAVSA